MDEEISDLVREGRGISIMECRVDSSEVPVRSAVLEKSVDHPGGSAFRVAGIHGR